MPPVLGVRLAQGHGKGQAELIDRFCTAPYVAASRLPRRLMVRLRTLNPSIVVRIHTGHPVTSFPIRLYRLVSPSRNQLALQLELWSKVLLEGTGNE